MNSRTIALFINFLFVFPIISVALGSTHNTIYDFAAPGTGDGMQPFSVPVFDSEGNLYATTMLGGTHNAGTIFELSPTGNNQWVETILYEFTGGTDGGYPVAGLTFDSSGNLYGTGGFGGANGTGVVFKLSPQSTGWSYTVLHSFGTYPTSGDGFAPNSPLVFDSNGNMYGITNEGGGDTGCFGGCGTVFELSPDGRAGWTEQVIHKFASTADGQFPTGAVTFGTDGNLYGTTTNGGTANSGVLYQLQYSTSTQNWTENIIHNFVGGTNDGSFPTNVILISDKKGNLYGTTDGGGSHGFGTVFEMRKSGGNAWKSKILYSFNATYSGDGNSPHAGVIMDTAGTLYGTTFYGGAANYYGTVYKLSRAKGKWSETVLYSFTGGTDGFYPQAGLALSNGWLYGTTDLGGNNSGAVYQNSAP
jgi:uncharacterized repeat protein (TIGR03803 family)